MKIVCHLISIIPGTVITLGSDICEKLGSSGKYILLNVAGFGNSCANECSEPILSLLGSLRTLLLE